MAMAINMEMIKDLREKTSAGISDCKKALEACNGNIEESIDWLRKKGIASAGKKAGRDTADGAVAINVNSAETKATVIEVNIETDFAAKNERFRDVVNALLKLADANEDADTDSLMQMKINNVNVEDFIKENISVIGENIKLRRIARIGVNNGVVVQYIHNKTFDNQGKIGVAVALESKSSNKDRLKEVAKQIAMHIAANKPESLDVASLDPQIVEREKDILIEQARASGKPDNVIEKMIQGRVNKFYGEVVLLEQPFVMDSKLLVKQVVENLSKELGEEVKLTAFASYILGEGIQKSETTSFADEVASIVGSK